MATEDHQVRHFDEELATLSERLLEMGRLARVRVGEAMRGLIERDAEALDAVIKGDALSVKSLLSVGADPNSATPSGSRPLLVALARNNTSAALALLDGGRS